MAKFRPLDGKMSGKLGGRVYAIRNGEQIVRERPLSIYNPKSALQSEVRAKLKILSQFSAVMSPVLAYQTTGAVSQRNMFTKVNYPAVTYANSKAEISLTDVKITNGIIGLPGVGVTREESSITVRLAGPNYTVFDAVVYSVLSKQSDGFPRIAGSQVVTTPGVIGAYEATIPLQSAETRIVVYAYGIRYNTERARVSFGNLQVLTSEAVASLLVTSNMTASDVTMSETRSIASDPA